MWAKHALPPIPMLDNGLKKKNNLMPPLLEYLVAKPQTGYLFLQNKCEEKFWETKCFFWEPQKPR